VTAALLLRPRVSTGPAQPTWLRDRPRRTPQRDDEELVVLILALAERDRWASATQPD
jgi:hypothetical protein